MNINRCDNEQDFFFDILFLFNWTRPDETDEEEGDSRVKP